MAPIEIYNDEKVLEEHSRDKSVFKIKPKEVIFPKSVSEIQKVIIDNPEENFSVRSGGTCMSGGSLVDGVIFNMTKYMSKVTIDPVGRTATAEGGAMLKTVMDMAHEHGLMFAPYPSSKDICGVGGVIGNNASGEKSIRFGATINNILGLEVVLSDGTIINTGVLENQNNPEQRERLEKIQEELLKLKNDAGKELLERMGNVPKVASGYRLDKVDVANPDITPIFSGAQGTLGIITKAVLKLVPIPNNPKLVVIPIDSIEELPFILKTIMKYGPEAVETFDVNTFNKAQNLIPECMDRCKHFFNKNTHLVILAEFSEEMDYFTDKKTLELMNELKKKNIESTKISDKKVYDSIWNIRRNSFTLMSNYNDKNFHAVPCIEDIIVPLESFDKLISSLMQIIKKHQISYGFHGHIGDGSIRVIPVFDWSKDKKTLAKSIIDFTREVIVLVQSLNGNISADHSDGIIRSPFLKEFYGDNIFDIFKKIKNLFDPEGRFNSKKKTGGTFEEIYDRLID